MRTDPTGVGARPVYHPEYCWSQPVSTYAELLRDPRWQKKRLEVMEDAEWRCEHCANASQELHVHHTYYEKGRMPWEYIRRHLRCLCKDCHERWHEADTALKRIVGSMDIEQLCRLITFANTISGDVEKVKPNAFEINEIKRRLARVKGHDEAIMLLSKLVDQR